MSERKSTNTSILILILVVAFAVGYLYYSQALSSQQVAINPPPITDGDSLTAFENLTIDFSILDDERFRSLRVFGESPVNPGVTGKRDLFAPF